MFFKAPSAALLFTKKHAPTSNINGLVTLEIGGGNVILGSFDGIDWGSGPYFIKTETDPTGGTTYTITGTSQLLSVPYALHANTADSIVGGISLNETDPVFGASLASGITSTDTANWNDHTVDTQLDSARVAALVFLAGPHSVGLIYKGRARAKNESNPNPNNAIPTGTSVKIPWTFVNENYGNSIGGTNNRE